VHHLAGTSGIFGLHEVGRAALQLEEALDRQVGLGSQPLGESDRRSTDRLVDLLQACSAEVTKRLTLSAPLRSPGPA
jgi:HPt (histidine-containing phosphotransfer) domain-containing protein